MWILECPKCGAEDTMNVIGGKWSGSTPLCVDGFAIGDGHCDTEDELVWCTACEKKFPLSEVPTDDK
jgi:hypothetical protein